MFAKMASRFLLPTQGGGLCNGVLAYSRKLGFGSGDPANSPLEIAIFGHLGVQQRHPPQNQSLREVGMAESPLSPNLSLAPP